jgi:hypothetical protein
MGRWQRYWFAEGGRTALAIVRICVALAVLLTLARLMARASPVAIPVYRPVGIWMLLGHLQPPALGVQVVWVVAWASTAAMLVGYVTRASTAISFVSAVALAALSFSASKTWSHQYNVVFIAQFALLGSRGGDWEILTTSAFVTIIVPLIVFFSLQRYFVRGLLAGSVKGG